MSTLVDLQRRHWKLRLLFGVLYVLIALVVFLTPHTASKFMTWGFWLIIIGFIHNEATILARDRTFIEKLNEKLEKTTLDETTRASINSDSTVFLKASPFMNPKRMIPILIGFILWFLNEHFSSGFDWIYDQAGSIN